MDRSMEEDVLYVGFCSQSAVEGRYISYYQHPPTGGLLRSEVSRRFLLEGPAKFPSCSC